MALETPAASMGAMAARLRRVGTDAGLDRLGFCAADSFPAVRDDLGRRTRAGLAGRLGFTAAAPDRAADVTRSAPWAVSLAVGARAYPSAGRAELAADRGRVAAFAAADHYRPLRAGLAAVAEELTRAGYRTLVLCDDNRLVDRAAAVRAGIGWWGKNTMVLAPGFGPRLLLGAVVTDAELPADGPMRRGCGKCEACLPACPTGAFSAPGVLDASRCISHWLQAPGVIPLAYRAAIGDRFYGCDDCLDACPPGKSATETAVDGSDMLWVLTAPGREVMERFAAFYIPRRDVDHLRRNALVVLGNVGSGRARAVVERYLESASALLRAHAVWAAARLGADGVLATRAAAETDAVVRAEYEHVRSGRVTARIESSCRAGTGTL